MKKLLLLLAVLLASAPLSAEAVEVCGNGVDDDANHRADEGCYTANVTGVCESPLSCALTGAAAPKTGQLIYAEAPDLEPRVPYGPPITLRRTYISTLSLGSGLDASLGYGWRHNFMSSVQQSATSPYDALLRTTTSEDIVFERASTPSGGYYYFTPQPGRHYDYLRRNVSTGAWQLRTLDGTTYAYDSNGLLTSITDGVGNAVTLTYSSGYLTKVTDASGEHELRFTYTSGRLDTVELYVGGTSYATIDYAVSSTDDQLDTVKYGTTTMRAYSWNSSVPLLQSISDGTTTIATYAWLIFPTLKVESIATGDGTLAFDYGDANCNSGAGLMVSYNYTDDVDASCTTNSDCSPGFCGGRAGGGGTCYRAQRCIETSSPSEDVVDAVSSPACATCTDTQAYGWDTASGKLDMTLKVSSTNLKTTYAHDGHGQVTTMVEDDADGSNSTLTDGRVTHYFRANSSYPAL